MGLVKQIIREIEKDSKRNARLRKQQEREAERDYKLKVREYNKSIKEHEREEKRIQKEEARLEKEQHKERLQNALQSENKAYEERCNHRRDIRLEFIERVLSTKEEN